MAYDLMNGIRKCNLRGFSSHLPTLLSFVFSMAYPILMYLYIDGLKGLRALDKEGYQVVYRLLARLKNRVTLILVSDDLNIIGLSDREYVLEQGHLTQKEFLDPSKLHDVKPYQVLRL